MKNRIPDLAIDNHPELVTNEAIALNPARYALRQIWESWAKLREAEAVTTDKRRLARAAQSVVNHTGKVADEALKNLDSFRKDLDAKVENGVAPKAADPAALEIRAHFKNQRHPVKLFGERVTAGDRRTVAAVLSAPAFLSGLTDEQHRTMRDHARRTFFPEECATIDDIDRHGQRVIIAMSMVKSTLEPLIKEWSGEKEEKAFAAFNGGAA